MTISSSAFTFVRELVRAESAIVLEPGKEYLVESRLVPLARAALRDGRVPAPETRPEAMSQ